jgi:putative membrane-bound dehydrogenase-like protein
MPQQALRRWWNLAILSALTVLGLGVVPANQEKAPPPSQGGDNGGVPIKVPPGFIVERVAGPPLVEHPVMAGFDERGRLYVAESAGLNLKAPDLLKQLPDKVLRLEDTNGDGIFDRRTVFADRMSFPMGVLWHDGAVYTCSPPSLWKLEDADGDGVADKRTEVVSKFGFTGNAADIHGPFRGPDGRLYWCDGRHGHAIDTAEGKKLQGKAARIFRCRPDSRDVEVVCGGGMDNPVETTFTDEGEAFATVDILIGRPARNDAIIHCIEGGVFPYHEVYREFKSTGDLLPPVTWLGWVAPSGLMRYRSTTLGPEYRDNLFSSQFNTHKVQRHVLKREGATFSAKNEDFLVSTDPDFHPTDVLEDADGSLLVVDTGGWFRIGCPTSQIAKPQITGAIYRIRKTGAPAAADPWGLKIMWDRLAPRELARHLDDPRWAVSDRAIEQLARKGSESLPVLKDVLSADASVVKRRNAVWALCRMDDREARTLNRIGLKDKEATVRNAAVHAAGLHRDGEAVALLNDLVVKDSAAEVRRCAATALGRLHNREAVPFLFEALRGPADRFLEHSLIYALIQIASREDTLKGLNDSTARVRRAALIALDQMDNGNLTRDLVVPLLDADDAALQQTVLTTVTARPDWAPELKVFLRRWVMHPNLPENRHDILRSALIAFARDVGIQELVAGALQYENTSPPIRILLLETLAQAPLEKLPASWLRELERSLDHPQESVGHQAIATIRTRNLKDFDPVLQRLGADAKRPAGVRVAALAALAPRLGRVEPPIFDFLIGRLDPNLTPLDRLSAAAALGPMRLADEQLGRLAQAVTAAGALELPHLIGPFEHSKDSEVGRKLLAALDKAPGLTSLSPENVQRTLQGYPEEVRQGLAPFLQRLEFDLEKKKARLAELAPVLLGGDAKRGRALFYGNKAACSTCHAVKSEGGQIGPDLSTIGGIRTGRDLLEAIAFPSASFVRGYEPYVVATKDGRLHNGILKRETPDAIYLVTAERTEIRLARPAIETIDPAKASIMPQGLDMQLSRQEMADLIAYLVSLR